MSAVLILNLTACGKSNNENNNVSGTTINIASMKGPTSIGLVKLYSDSDNDLTHNHYNYSVYGAADEITGGLIKGEIDVAAVPANLASVLFNKTEGGIITAGINTLGVTYILTTDPNVNTLQDLKGKTIYATGQGTTPEYTLRHILSSNGIDPDKDVNIQYYKEGSEVVANASLADNAILMLPQPYATIAMNQMENCRNIIDLNKEWSKISEDSNIVTGVIVVRKEFLENNREDFDKFLEEYGNSTEFANKNTEECAELLEKYDIFKAAIALKAIPYCNVTLITGTAMKEQLIPYLQVLSDANPASVGGSIPDDTGFYINK
jgi:NitT/TauT family transport system substrate-binding protein